MASTALACYCVHCLDEYHVMDVPPKGGGCWATFSVVHHQNLGVFYSYDLPLLFVPACQTANNVDILRYIVKQN